MILTLKAILDEVELIEHEIRAVHPDDLNPAHFPLGLPANRAHFFSESGRWRLIELRLALVRATINSQTEPAKS